jgi:small ligand-binding sensory domain FIST
VNGGAACEMVFASASAAGTDEDELVSTLLSQIQSALGAAAGPDLVIAFISAQLTHIAAHLASRLHAALAPRVMLACTSEGVIDREREIEGQPAVALTAALLPGVTLAPFHLHLSGNDRHRLLLNPESFRNLVDAPEDTRIFILLGDPFSTPMDDVLQAFNSAYPGVPVVGGMASGALRPEGNVLVLNDGHSHEGAVGVALAGALDVDVVVSQGCRPIWQPFRVDAAHRNVILSLQGRPPLAWIQDLIPGLSEDDRALLQNGLFVGRAVKHGQEGFGRGDFLIRGVVGIDQSSGAIAIGDSVMEGETIQFHLRDAFTAQEDLEMMLIPQMFRPPAAGGLLFSCNGRGTRLYDHPDGDISIIQHSLGNTHLAGFFCAGEIGPIGGANFLHGQTASLVLFRPLATTDSPD